MKKFLLSCNVQINSIIIALLMAMAFQPAVATQIEFTGGSVLQNDGGVGVTNNSNVFQNVASYTEQGFKFEFLFDSAAPSAFASIIGDYYSTGNDVVHWHWTGGGFGEVTEVRVSKVDGTTFDLGGFRVSTNTSSGGGFSSGTELVSINTSKASSIFNVDSDNWGLGSGPDPLISINPSNSLFDDIAWFSFTNDQNSTAVGMGLDNFFLDEPGDPNGTDPTNPTNIPEPTSFALLFLGLAGLVFARRKIT